jgi:serine/threonine protein phosphatase PrpC
LHHSAKNELSQAIGRRPDVVCELRQLTLDRHDWLVLACDGLHAHLSNDNLAQLIELSQPAACILADHLIEIVNRRGGSDNCTVIAVHCP